MTTPFDQAIADLRIAGSVVLHDVYRGSWAIDIPAEDRLQEVMGCGRRTRVLPFHLVRRGGFRLRSGATATDVA